MDDCNCTDQVDKLDHEVMLPGFRFHPTDEELFGFYLKKKIQNRILPIELIKQVDIYKYDPWELPALAVSGEEEWYFYCPRDRKYKNSARLTGSGFWRSTGTDLPIYSSYGAKCIGLKKSLVFYRGRPAKGIKTNWMMHEFRLPSLVESQPNKKIQDKSLPPNDAWAICRIFVKTISMAQRAIFRSWQQEQEQGLGIMFHAQELIPYKSINGLKPVSEEIEAALKIICVSHQLPLSQVWIAYEEDESHVPFSSSVEDTQTKRPLPLKLTGYFSYESSSTFFNSCKSYHATCDMISLIPASELVEKTLQDYEPRFCRNINDQILDTLMRDINNEDSKICGLTICLRSIDTSDFNYVFEFIWEGAANDVIMLEAILLTIKRCLPRFKFASGAELGDELNVIDFKNSRDHDTDYSTDSDAENSTAASENNIIKIFQEKRVSPMLDALEKGTKPMVANHAAATQAKCKTALKPLSKEVIEQQYGNTQEVAARNLNVCLSTLKRKCHGFGIFEWQGPKVAKRKPIDSSGYTRNRNEEDNRAIQEPLVVDRNENNLTIKAEYGGDMVKLTFHISQATFVNVKGEIGKRFNMTPGTYKLKYLDEDEDLILLSSDQDMSECIKSMTNTCRNVVRMHVIPST